ncbi:YesL family protein [Bifidobacterium pullorum]|uniref:YesL family protein n=2 Tax=Bifidobacterium TaxID=1678 RepID=UPI0005297FB0|nr:YesL family protein [Bifidobacterium pullorum]
MAPDNKKRPSKLYRLFDSENGFFRIMAVVFDLIELNVLTLLCCVPIVTAGASFTAMHNTLWHMVRHEEGYVHTHFFRAFKENFKQATVVWLVCLAIIIVMLGDISIMGQLDPVFHGVLLVVLVIVGLAAVTIAQYYFVFLSRYDNPVKVQLRNAAMAAIGFFPRTAGMLVILGAFGFAYAAVLVYVVPLILLLGIALPQYCCALLYCPIFERLEGAPAES